jgi:hypothetical protein
MFSIKEKKKNTAMGSKRQYVSKNNDKIYIYVGNN